MWSAELVQRVGRERLHGAAVGPLEPLAGGGVGPPGDNPSVARDEQGLPIVPHEAVGGDCCGCLVVELRGDQVNWKGHLAGEDGLNRA